MEKVKESIFGERGYEGVLNNVYGVFGFWNEGVDKVKKE